MPMRIKENRHVDGVLNREVLESKVAVRIDQKGRISIPRHIRNELNLQPGDLIYLRRDNNELRAVKGINPFDQLADQAESDFRSGKTRNL